MKKKPNQKLLKKLCRWLQRFPDVPILVVGDLMIDRALRGPVERISPEAPVPVVDVREETQTPGGAGNVVNNLLALGAKPTLVSIRGNDWMGRVIEDDLKKRGINLEGLLVDPTRKTSTKTRVIANSQQVVRIDVEDKHPISGAMLKTLTAKLHHLIPKHKAVIISDYGKGIITPPVIKEIIRVAHRHRLPVVVDPKIEHFQQYKGVDCITPNTKEATEGMRVMSPKSDSETVMLGKKILKKLKCRTLVITRGEKGMMLFERGGRVTSIPTRAREVFDVTGAGDTVISTLTTALAVGVPFVEAAHLANYAASLVVAKLGTAVATRAELQNLIESLL